MSLTDSPQAAETLAAASLPATRRARPERTGEPPSLALPSELKCPSCLHFFTPPSGEEKVQCPACGQKIKFTG